MQEPVELKNTILYALIDYLQLADIDQNLLDTDIVLEIQGKLVLPSRRLDEFYRRHKKREERFTEEDRKCKGLPILTVRGAQSVAMILVFICAARSKRASTNRGSLRFLIQPTR